MLQEIILYAAVEIIVKMYIHEKEMCLQRVARFVDSKKKYWRRIMELRGLH